MEGRNCRGLAVILVGALRKKESVQLSVDRVMFVSYRIGPCMSPVGARDHSRSFEI